MLAPDTLLADAGLVLSNTLNRPVSLVEPTVLESEGLVLRARVDPDGFGPEAVVVKRVTDTTFDQPGHRGPPQRFLNEWAALEFLTSLGLGGEACPTLLCADVEGGFLVLGDLGGLVDLQTVLLSDQPRLARAGLVDMGRTLGRIHATTHDIEGRFHDLQVSLGTGSPRCDSTVDQRTREEVFSSCLRSLAIAPETGFWDAVVRIESMIHDQTPFWALIHADAGPQNFLVADGGGALVDFEYAVYRNGLCDVVGARLGFPQTTRAMTVSAADAARVETAYREAVSTVIPQAGDDSVFFSSLTAAGGHWALNRWAAAWRRQVGPLLESGREPGDGEISALSSTLLVLDGFVALAGETGTFPEIAGTVASFVAQIHRRWPEVRPPPGYPALRNG
ncbi:MAG: phosphotransferase [Acidimicrobiia bacterium]|jgi:hypothetical protein